MTDSHYIRRQRERTIARLMDEVRPLPTLDPGTDFDDADNLCIGGYTYSLMMAANAILAHTDHELLSELPDLRTVAEQLLARVEKLGG